MPRIRVFLAIPVPTSVQERLHKRINALAETCDGVRWTDSKDMHLTLKFFGEIEQRRTIDICRCVERTLTAKHRFQISLVGLGAFPDLERPRTLWAGLGLGRDTLTSLQQSIDEDLTIEGHPSESRRYHPHITIGRVRSKSGSPGISAVIAAHVNEAYGELPVDRVVMYSSRLKRSGPVYTQLATMPLPDSRQ